MLKQLMEESGVSVRQLAKACGVSGTMVAHWRTGQSKPTAKHARTIGLMLLKHGASLNRVQVMLRDWAHEALQSAKAWEGVLYFCSTKKGDEVVS